MRVILKETAPRSDEMMEGVFEMEVEEEEEKECGHCGGEEEGGVLR